MKTTSHSLADTKMFAEQFVASLKKGGAACVVGLYGNLGAGKTAFTQQVAEVLGVKETVTSPTYVIEKIYTLENLDTTARAGFKHLIHIDAYRLDKAAELAHLGWKDLIADPENLILIEWPERVAEIMPIDHIRLQFTFINETTREIEG